MKYKTKKFKKKNGRILTWCCIEIHEDNEASDKAEFDK